MSTEKLRQLLRELEALATIEGYRDAPDVAKISNSIRRLIDSKADSSELLAVIDNIQFYVTDFGALGDGSNDDTASIQACIDAAEAVTGRVIFPAGTYKITDNLTIDSALLVTGTGAEITQVTSNKRGFWITSSNVTIESLKITGPQFANQVGTEIGIHIAGASAGSPVTDITIRNCEINTFGDYGIRAKWIHDFKFIDNRIYDIEYTGIIVVSGLRGLIHKNIINNMTDNTNAYGISVGRAETDSLATDPRSSHIVISDNVIYDIPTWHGLDSHGGEYIDFIGNTVRNCFRGINVAGSDDSGNNTLWAPMHVNIIGNTFISTVSDGTLGAGINVAGAPGGAAGSPTELAEGIVISGNNIVGHGKDQNSSGAINCKVTQGLVVSGNNIWDAAPCAIHLYYDNYGVSVTGNTVVDPWSDNTALATAVFASSTYNTGVIGGNSFSTDDKSATHVLSQAIRITNNANNDFTLLGDYNRAAIPLVATFPQYRAQLLDRNVLVGTTSPSTGTWVKGDIVFTAPSAGDEAFLMWICTAGGSPGTWTQCGRLNDELLTIAGSTTAPEFILHNTTEEDGAGGRQGTLRWKGEQSGGEFTTLSMIRGSHDGAADDEKGKIEVSINDGGDSDAPTLRMLVDTLGITGNFVSDGLSGFNVLAYGAIGDGGTDDRTAINNAHTAATANGGYLIFPPGTYKLSSSITFNSDVTLWFHPGAKLSVDNTYTATINGKIHPTLHHIFSGAGSVTLATDSCECTYPQWWGALADDSNDDTAAIQASFDAAPFVTFLPTGTYKTTAAVTLSSNHGKRIVGSGRAAASIIKVYGGGNAIEITGTRFSIETLRVLSDANTGSGILVSAGDGTIIDSVHIGGNGGAEVGFDRGVDIASTANYTKVTNCYLRDNNDGIYMWNGGAGNGPNACMLVNNVILGGNYAIRNILGTDLIAVGNSFEGYATRGILLTDITPMVSHNHFESAGVIPIELAAGVIEARIFGNTYSGITDVVFVTDNSGSDFNEFRPAKMLFGYPGQSSAMADNYGGSLELGFDGSDITDLKLQTTKGHLQFETTAADKVIQLLSETRATEPFVFTPTGGFGRRGENRVTYSEDWSDASWVKTNVTVTTDAIAAPNGRTTADKLESTVAAGNANQVLNGGVAIDGSITPVEVRFRVWARAVTGTNADFAIMIRSASLITFFRPPDLTTTWKLYEMTHTHNYNEALNVRIYPAESGTDDVYVWGAHVVYGTDDSPVPYIKTTYRAIAVDTPALVAADAIVAGGIGQFGDDVTIKESAPEVVLHNTTAEDADGGREGSVRFKGVQSGAELTTLAMIRGSHDGAADDEKGQVEILINDTNDADSPTLQVTIDSVDVTLERGILALPETTTPSAVASVGKIYNKSDNRLYFQDGAGGEHLVHPVVTWKSFSFRSRDVATGMNYIAGYYSAPTADANLDQGGATITYGGANHPYAAHAFIVSGGNGTTDGSDLVLTVSGTSIADDGTRTAADSEVIEATAGASALNSYYESTKKWLGTVTFTLTSTGGTAFSYDFNYGFAKYEDFGNRDFTLNDFEIVGLADANDNSFDVEILRHETTGWTFSAAAFVPGSSALYKQTTIHSTESDLDSGEPFAFKRTGLSDAVNGNDGEGILIRVTTGAAKAIAYMDAHVGVELDV